MKRLILSVLALAIFLPFTAKADNDRPIPPEQLPEAAKTFIQKTFPEIAIAYAEIETEGQRTKYEVRLNDGTEIDFNGAGEWDKVDCNYKAVPAVLVPEAIANYVKTNYASAFIVKIDKELYGWDIELNNDLDLMFSADFKFLGIDD